MKIIDDFFPPEKAAELEYYFSFVQNDAWVEYDDLDFEYRKRTVSELNKMPPVLAATVRDLALHPPETDLCPDPGLLAPEPYLWGGGLHQTRYGGYLAMHKDFNVLPSSYTSEKQLERVLNLIVYLSDAPSGELYVDGMEPVQAKANRAVWFDPRDTFHGHPWPYRKLAPRNSIAVYFYRERIIPQDEWRSTVYRPLPFREDTPMLQAKLALRADPSVRYRKWWPK